MVVIVWSRQRDHHTIEKGEADEEVNLKLLVRQLEEAKSEAKEFPEMLRRGITEHRKVARSREKEYRPAFPEEGVGVQTEDAPKSDVHCNPGRGLGGSGKAKEEFL